MAIGFSNWLLFFFLLTFVNFCISIRIGLRIRNASCCYNVEVNRRNLSLTIKQIDEYCIVVHQVISTALSATQDPSLPLAVIEWTVRARCYSQNYYDCQHQMDKKGEEARISSSLGAYICRSHGPRVCTECTADTKFQVPLEPHLYSSDCGSHLRDPLKGVMTTGRLLRRGYPHFHMIAVLNILFFERLKIRKIWCCTSVKTITNKSCVSFRQTR